VKGIPPKNDAQQLPSLNPEKKGPTVSLLLRMCKPLYTKGTIVILDSGFCVLKGIVELMKKGLYAGALIKNVDTGQSLSKGILWIRE